tara:strand:- start:2786 stop:3214 length:429 start_codon:yes stop_codon:yes gene_type:complete
MPLTKLQFRPGINKEGTSYSNEGGWFDGDKVRFRSGYVERIGGWQKVNGNEFDGQVRKLFNFVTLDDINYLFMGSSAKVYLEESSVLYDITPIRRSVLLPHQLENGIEATSSLGTATAVIGTSSVAGNEITASVGTVTISIV